MNKTVAEQIAKENIALWQEAAGENRELRLLQASKWGEQCAILWQQGALTDEVSLVLPTPTLPKSDLVFPPTRFARMLTMEEQIAFCKAFLPDFLPDHRHSTQDQSQKAESRRHGKLLHEKINQIADFTVAERLLFQSRSDPAERRFHTLFI